MNRSSPHIAARALDHAVLPVADLGVARRRLTALGFTVAPDAQHPFGTANCCVYLADGTYLEPLAVVDRRQARDSAMAGNVFTARDGAYRQSIGEEGFSGLALATGDADGDQATFIRAGISAGGILEFSRPFVAMSGAIDTASFRLAFAVEQRWQDMLLFTCQRVNAPKLGRSALQAHTNAVRGVRRVVLLADRPAELVDFLCAATGVATHRRGDGHIEIEAANATIVVATPAIVQAAFGGEPRRGGSPRLAGIVFEAAGLAAVEACLKAGQLAFQQLGDRLVVQPAPGQGAFFAFEASS